MIRSAVLRFMRVPPEPDPPPGSVDNLRVFRAADNFYRYRLVGWGVGQVGALIGLVFVSLAIGSVPEPLDRWLFGLEILGWLGYIVQLPFTWAMMRLDYDLRWYIVSDRSLRIREGIASVKEKTMTFANIQNLSIHQGPLQRLLGISDLEVRTAGGGGSASEQDGEHGGESFHVAKFRGVDNASEIRELILARVRRQKDSGLGDPDDLAGAPESGLGSDAVQAARAVLEETRQLRRAIAQTTRHPAAE